MKKNDHPGKILLVDDTTSTLDMMKSNLESEGYKVYIATSGEKAIKSAELTLPDLILLDILMPGIDGYETCRQLKANKNIESIPVIFMSALNESFDKVKGFKLGAVDYIVKPVDTGELLSRVQTHVTMRRLQIELKEANAKLKERVSDQNIELRGSHNFIESVLDNIPGMIFVKDARELKYVRLNKAGEELIGYSREELMGKNDYDFFPKDEADFFTSKDREVLESGTLLDIPDEPVLTKNNGLRYLHTKKIPIFNIKGEPEYLLGISEDITEKKQVEEALVESNERFRALYEDNPTMYFTVDDKGSVLSVNPFGAQQLGYTVQELVGQPVLNIFFQDDKKAAQEQLANSLQNPDQVMHWELRKIRKDGSMLWVRETARAVQKSSGRLIVLIVCEDITEFKLLEKQLLQSQKMEAVGQLAGGIAHDFNNILSAIIGYSNLLQYKIGEDNPLREYIDHIINSADRAAKLTHSLLAFSRKQIINPKSMQLNKIVSGVEKLLLRLIGEHIELKTALSDKKIFIFADYIQIEQVLMNLATNARDAMPHGGICSIETKLVELNKEFVKTHNFGNSGEYALITFSDSGIGMDESTKEKIFEPFFTTKESGRGTGLGLAVTYGIVKQHDGHISVYSEPGLGTTFKIYLPIVKEDSDEKLDQKADNPPVVQGGTETILLAEDDKILRNLAGDALKEFGYRVIIAEDGNDAIIKYKKNKDIIKLLILDLVMPKKNGKEVYGEVKIIKPDIKALFVSGYTADLIHENGILEKGLNCILKPFSVDKLLREVRKILDL